LGEALDGVEGEFVGEFVVAKGAISFDPIPEDVEGVGGVEGVGFDEIVGFFVALCRLPIEHILGVVTRLIGMGYSFVPMENGTTPWLIRDKDMFLKCFIPLFQRRLIARLIIKCPT